MAFYEEHDLDQAFRFGDVVQGFVSCCSKQDEFSFTSNPKLDLEYDINIFHSGYSVILTPCCSIGDKTITLCRLQTILPGFLNNDYLKIDLTNINRPMTVEQSIPPLIWEKLPDIEKQRRLDIQSQEGFAFVEYFVYKDHSLLPKYKIKTPDGEIDIGFYMIDFRRSYRVNSNKIPNAKQAPLELKVLQLSIQARQELRDKLAAYYTRVPQEDYQ